MPETMSVERRQLMKAYGAELVLTEGAKGMKGAIAKAEELAKEIPGSFIPGQFVNRRIRKFTREQPDQRSGKIRTARLIFCRWCRHRRNHHRNRKIFKETEPECEGRCGGTGKLSGIEPGQGRIPQDPGIGAGFVPDVLDTKVYDEIIAVENDNAFAAGKLVGKKEGVLVGISSGAAIWAAIELAKRPENAGKTIVALLPDTGDGYLSTPLFAD